MSDEKLHSSFRHTPVLRLEDVRRGRTTQNADVEPVRIKVEIACNEDVGQTIQSCITSELEQARCLVVADEKPDWILSVIAFRYRTLVELSIVLRRLFRSTVPGTEVERVDSDGRAVLREGGWLYESLRFHGLFGVREPELKQFLAQLVGQFKAAHWDTHNQTRSREGYAMKSD